MKQFVFLSLLCLAFASCGSADKEVKPVVFDVYKNYFFKNDTTCADNLPYYMAFTKFKNFEEYFGSAATMSKQKWIDPNSLANQIIIAVVDKVGNTTQDIKIESIKKKGDTLYVDYTITKRNEPVSFTSRYCAVAVAAARNIEKVIFSTEGNEVYQLDVK